MIKITSNEYIFLSKKKKKDNQNQGRKTICYDEIKVKIYSVQDEQLPFCYRHKEA